MNRVSGTSAAVQPFLTLKIRWKSFPSVRPLHCLPAPVAFSPFFFWANWHFWSRVSYSPPPLGRVFPKLLWLIPFTPFKQPFSLSRVNTVKRTWKTDLLFLNISNSPASYFYFVLTEASSGNLLLEVFISTFDGWLWAPALNTHLMALSII